MKKKTIIYITISLIIIVGVSSIVIIKELNGRNSINNTIFNETDNSTILRLAELSKQDPRINYIIENYEIYPDELLEMLSKNIETIDFVLNYPNQKDIVHASDIGEITKGEYPLLLQWDERWGYEKYGDSTIAVSGCAPVALSIVIAGLTGNNKITPYTIAKYAEEEDYYSRLGTSWSIMTEGITKFDIKGTEIALSKNTIYNKLNNGNPIICSMRRGNFTTTGHFIVLVGIEEGKIKIKDPNSIEKSNKLWDYETLENQIKNLWSFEEI